MILCPECWDILREKVADAGMAHLVAPDGETARDHMIRMLASGAEVADVEATIPGTGEKNFEPLLGAWVAVGSNAFDHLGRAGAPLRYFLTSGAPEDPVVGYKGYEDRTWPRCVVCYLSLAHEMTCSDARCTLDKVNGYRWMLEFGVRDQLKEARKQGLVE